MGAVCSSLIRVGVFLHSFPLDPSLLTVGVLEPHRFKARVFFFSDRLCVLIAMCGWFTFKRNVDVCVLTFTVSLKEGFSFVAFAVCFLSPTLSGWT